MILSIQTSVCPCCQPIRTPPDSRGNIASTSRTHNSICQKHKTLLGLSTAMQSGQARYSWIVPKHDDLTSPCKRGTKLGEIEIASLMQLAAASRWLLAVGRREVL